MFSIVRMVIGCVFFGVVFWNIKLSKLRTKRIWYGIGAGISVLLTTALCFVPFENLFFTFRTPEKAFRYYAGNGFEIEHVVEGEHSDFIVGRNGDTNTYLILPKTSDGWKVGMGANIKTVEHKYDNGAIITVYQCKNTGDYYVHVLVECENELLVSDNCGSAFVCTYREFEGLEIKYASCYANIAIKDREYRITVDGAECVFVLGQQ